MDTTAPTLDLAADLLAIIGELHTMETTPEQLAAAVVRLRAITTEATTTYLSDVGAATPMLDRLRQLAPLRDAAAQTREAFAAALEDAQGRLSTAIVEERKILDERIELVCGLSRLEPAVPITQIAAAAGLTRARVYRIIAEVKSHPGTCPCKS